MESLWFTWNINIINASHSNIFLPSLVEAKLIVIRNVPTELGTWFFETFLVPLILFTAELLLCHPTQPYCPFTNHKREIKPWPITYPVPLQDSPTPYYNSIQQPQMKIISNMTGSTKVTQSDPHRVVDLSLTKAGKTKSVPLVNELQTII